MLAVDATEAIPSGGITDVFRNVVTRNNDFSILPTPALGRTAYFSTAWRATPLAIGAHTTAPSEDQSLGLKAFK